MDEEIERKESAEMEEVEEKKTVRFIISSFFIVMIVCVVTFSGLNFFMSTSTERSVEDVSQIYMAEVCEQIQQKFNSIVYLRLSQVEGVIMRTPPKSVRYGKQMLKELKVSGDVRRFDYMGFYTEDGKLETIYGKDMKLESADEFRISLDETGDGISSGVGEDGQDYLLLAEKAAYPMEDGSRSAALIAGIPMQYLDEALYLDTEGGNVYSHIIDKDGNFVIRNTGEFGTDYFARIDKRFDSFDGKTPNDYKKELQEAMEKQADYFATMSVDGDVRHIYCAHIENTPGWYLIAVMPNEVLEEPIANLDRLRILVTIGCMAIIVLTMSFLFLHYGRKSKRQREAVERASKEAIRANQAKSEFLSSMSHDIRTPMNAIIGMTDIALAHKQDVDKVESCLRNIQTSNRHLLGLINDVLDMSKIESGKMMLNMSSLSLRETAESLVNIIQPQVREKRQSFDILVKDIEAETVFCDSVRLDQVLLNLLSNAVKFTPMGGNVNVAISQEKSPLGDGYVRTHFVVEDDGIGMSEEFQKKIFNKFSRENTERVQNTTGTGLGMAITKQIVDMMGGTIALDSELGKGSRFHVTLDLQKGADQAEMRLPAWNVLVVDDNEQLCASAVENLRELGVNGTWASSGMEAVNMVEERHQKDEDYQFVLIDWKMPQMDGLETIREIRSRIGEGIPMFLISAYNWSDIEGEVDENEINGFIGKPLFKSTIYSCLSRYAGADAPKEEPIGQQIDFTGKRLLVAEDVEINWIVVQESLSAFGFELEHAENGQVCLEILQQREPGFYDAILMDIRMPVMDGYETTRNIRAMDRSDKDIPIIAMTADAFSDDVKVCLDCGMDAHVAKPLDLKELIRTLQKFLGDGTPGGREQG